MKKIFSNVHQRNEHPGLYHIILEAHLMPLQGLLGGLICLFIQENDLSLYLDKVVI